MTSFAPSRLQEAVYALLGADPELAARLTGIYDEPPLGAKPPYLAFGDTNVTDGSVKDRMGAIVRFDVVVLSAETSQMEAKELAAHVEACLKGARPKVPGFEILAIEPQGMQVTRLFTEAGSLTRARLGFSVRLFEL